MKIRYRPDMEICDEYDRPMLVVSRFAFEAIHDGCSYYLLSIEGLRGETDGCHADPQGVAQARQLIESIDAIRKRPDRRYLMLQILPVPEHTGAVNQEAIDTLNAAHRSVRGRP